MMKKPKKKREKNVIIRPNQIKCICIAQYDMYQCAEQHIETLCTENQKIQHKYNKYNKYVNKTQWNKQRVCRTTCSHDTQ